MQVRKTNKASPDVEPRSDIDNLTPLYRDDFEDQMSPSKELTDNEVRTEMTCLPAAEDTGVQPVQRSGRAQKPTSYFKDFVLR